MMHLEGPEGAERVPRGGERVQAADDALQGGDPGRMPVGTHRGQPPWVLPPRRSPGPWSRTRGDSQLEHVAGGRALTAICQAFLAHAPVPAPTPATDRAVTRAVIECGDAAEDVPEYEAFRQAMLDHHLPHGPVEQELVDRLVDLASAPHPPPAGDPAASARGRVRVEEEAVMRTSYVLIGLVMAGCSSRATEDPSAGECDDDKDNDGDGWADCYDGDCYGSADCIPGDTEGGSDTDDVYTQEEFNEALIEAMCNKMDECGWLETLGWTLEECLNQGQTDTGGESPCEDFNPVAAQACVRAIEKATCDDYAAGIGLEACDDVCSS